MTLAVAVRRRGGGRWWRALAATAVLHPGGAMAAALLAPEDADVRGADAAPELEIEAAAA